MLGGMLGGWKAYKNSVVALAEARNDDAYTDYVKSVTDKMWKHVAEEEKLPARQAEERLRRFYDEDSRFFETD